MDRLQQTSVRLTETMAVLPKADYESHRCRLVILHKYGSGLGRQACLPIPARKGAAFQTRKVASLALKGHNNSAQGNALGLGSGRQSEP